MKLGLCVSALAMVIAFGCGRDGSRFADPIDPGADGGSSDPGTSDPTGYRDGGSIGTTGLSCSDAAKAQGYAGCDFVIAPPPVLPAFSRPPCFATMVANNANSPAKLKVSFNGKDAGDASKYSLIPTGADPSTWKPVPTQGIPPGAVAVVFLSGNPDSKEIHVGTSGRCPIDAPFNDGDFASGNPWPARGMSFHISSDNPVTVYDVSPFGGAKSFFPSADIVLPTTSWGTNYVVANPPFNVPADGSGPRESSWVMVLAKEDNTSVTIKATTDLEAKTQQDALNNKQGTVSLAAGEYILYYSWRVAGNPADISGTVVTSNKPVSVSGGDTATAIVSADSVKAAPIRDAGVTIAPAFCCLDSTHQQIPPVGSLGFEYVGAPYPTRRADLKDESIVYRIVGVVDGTKLTFDPPIPGAPTSVNQGEVVDFESTVAFAVSSQGKTNPFIFTQTMSYSTVAGGTRRDGDSTWAIQPAEIGQRETGDPEWILSEPPAQFIKQYAFVTDPTYAVTSLVLTRTNDGGKGFSDVTLACAGMVTGWNDIGKGGKYQYAQVDLVRDGKGIGSCTNGAQSAKSAGPFGVTVWGIDWWASYAYSAGGGAGKINDVVVTPN